MWASIYLTWNYASEADTQVSHQQNTYSVNLLLIQITAKQLIYNKFYQPTSLQQDCKIITEEIDSNKCTDRFCGSFPDIYYTLYGFCEI